MAEIGRGASFAILFAVTAIDGRSQSASTAKLPTTSKPSTAPSDKLILAFFIFFL